MRTSPRAARMAVRPAGLPAAFVLLLAFCALRTAGAGEPQIAVAFFPVDKPIYFKGEGGTSYRVGSVEFWATGRPPLRNRMIGSLVVSGVSSDKNQTPSLDDPRLQSLVEDKVARAVLTMNDDAVIPMGRTSSGQQLQWTYRVVKFVSADEAPGAATEFDAPFRAPDGRLLPNGDAMVPIAFATMPKMHKFMHGLGPGQVLVHFCVAPDGALVGQPEVRDSSRPKLGDAAIRMVQEAKYKPATVGGVAINACKDMKVTLDGRE